MTVYNNAVLNREQFAQGRARALVRAMEDFARRGRREVWDLLPSQKTLRDPITPQTEQHLGVEGEVEIPFCLPNVLHLLLRIIHL